MAGVAPGEVVLINATLQGLPIDAGVMVLYADDELFTVMTPQGFPESGWNTFSAYDEDGVTVVQISVPRTSCRSAVRDRFSTHGSRAQEQIWKHVLTSIATHFGIDGQVEISKTCVDPRLQWSEAKNVWHNAGIRTTLYTMSAPLRWVCVRIKR